MVRTGQIRDEAIASARSSCRSTPLVGSRYADQDLADEAGENLVAVARHRTLEQLGTHGAVDATSPRASREVTSAAEARVRDAGVMVIAVGQEAGGRVGADSAFILLEAILGGDLIGGLESAGRSAQGGRDRGGCDRSGPPGAVGPAARLLGEELACGSALRTE